MRLSCQCIGGARCAKWGRNVVAEYLLDTKAKCEREPTPVMDSNLIRYAFGLLDSELRNKYLSGARMLDAFIKQGEDVRSLLLLSRPKIQKLIDTLGWRSNGTANNFEIREHAARILADLAGDIYLVQFPGAIQCIASLFQTNDPYCNERQAVDDSSSPQNKLQAVTVSGGGRIKAAFDTTIERPYTDGNKSCIQDMGGAGSFKELILQGLTILERLASNQHNCSEICGIPGLVPMILAPIYSSTLIKDIKIGGWTDVVSRSLNVLLKLIRCPGTTGKRLRCDVYSNEGAMSNLEHIIDQGNEAGEKLRMAAVEILTELATDSSIDINRSTEESIIKNQMEIFLDNEGKEKPGSMLRTAAGQTLALLSRKQKNCLLITNEFSNIFDRLTIILAGANINSTCRAIAAEILENLCTSCQETLQQQNVAETLLSKVRVHNYVYLLRSKVMASILSKILTSILRVILRFEVLI
jgi:hypothetical protein